MVKKRITKLYEDVVRYIEQRKEFSDEELLSSGRQTEATIADYRKTAKNLSNVNKLSGLYRILTIIATIALIASIFVYNGNFKAAIEAGLLIVDTSLLVKAAVCQLDKVMIKKLQINNEDLQAVYQSADRI